MLTQMITNSKLPIIQISNPTDIYKIAHNPKVDRKPFHLQDTHKYTRQNLVQSWKKKIFNIHHCATPKGT